MILSGYAYVASAGESFDSVALTLWGDEIHAAELLCANPEYSGRLVFEGGEKLHIPVVDTGQEDAGDAQATPQKAPWR